jgi:hypothetical protein
MKKRTAQEAENIKKKWKPLIEGKITGKDGEVQDLGLSPIKADRKSIVATLLENTVNQYVEDHGHILQETTNLTTGIDIVDPVLINLVRRMAPNLLAYDLVGVQPMNGPTGLIFALRSYYTSQPTGPFGRPGDARDGFQTGSALNGSGRTTAQESGYNGYATDEALHFEADTTFSGAGTQSANDGNTAYSAYSVGTAETTANGETAGRGLSGDIDWNEMAIAIEKTNVVAGTRFLKAEYTHELAQDLKATHGLDAETELSNLLSTEIVTEINRELVNRIRQIAKIAPGEYTYDNGVLDVDSNGDPITGTAGQFDLNTNSDGRWSAEKYKSLLMKINKEANAIAKDTRRGRGNFIICSSDVASALDLSGKLDFAPAVDNNLTVDDTGNTFVGILQNRFKVYIDPYVLYDEIIVGYKGPNNMDAGMFYCPYVPLQMYKALGQDTFQPKIAFKTRYGIVANPFTTLVKNQNTYYRKFKVLGL